MNSDFESDSYQKITDWYLERIQVLFKNRIYIPVQSRLESIDNVICCGIHSQLLAVLAQIACVFGRVISMNIQAVFQRISMLNDVVCSQLTDDLFAVSKHSVILGLERIHVGMEGEIEGASQAFHSLSPYWIYLKDRSSLIWPFDKAQGKVYSMEILDFGCKENLFK